MLKYEEELDIPYPRRKYLEKEINKIELAEILQSERTRNIYNEALADGPIFHIVITLYKDSLLKESVNIKDNDRAAAAVDSAHIIEKILYKGMLFELEDRLRLKREERLRRQSKDED